MHFLTILTILLFGSACNGTVKKDLAEKREDVQILHNIVDPRFGDVRCSLQDKEGNLWFGTMVNGLYKYDGKSFSQFTMNDGLDCNNIYCMMEDKNGKIWVGTEAGLCLYNGKSFEKVGIPLPKNLPPNKNPYYQNHWVYSMIQAKTGKLWFATIDGIYIYDGKSFTPFELNEAANGFLTSNDKVERILEDNAGNIWMGGRTNEGVFRYDGKSITQFKLNELIQNENTAMAKPHKWAWPQVQDKNGNIWFSNWGGAYRYDGKTFTGFSSKEGLTVRMVATIIEDKNGGYWFCGDGLYRYDGKSFTRFSSKDGLAYLGGWSILESKSGNLWIGTKDAGLYIFDGQAFTNFSEYKYPPATN